MGICSDSRDKRKIFHEATDVKSGYLALDTNKTYYLLCPSCNSDIIFIKDIKYDKEKNDYKCWYNCRVNSTSLLQDYLLNFLKESKEEKNIYYENLEKIEEIFDDVIYDEFNGYPIIDSIIKKLKNIFFDKLYIIKENNPIKNILWLDDKINSKENQDYIKIIQNEFSSIDLFTTTDEQILFQKINQLKFQANIIIIKRINFRNYINYLTSNSIYNIPVTIIFTRDKKKLIDNLDIYSKKYINDKFYNPLGIVVTIDCLIKSIKNYIKELNYKINLIQLHNLPNPMDYKDCYTFEYIDNDYKLIFPFLYNNIMKNAKVDNKEIKTTNKYILENYGQNKQINSLIVPLLKTENIPENVLSKFWARIYTVESPFYRNLNNNLMKLKSKDYNSYIQILYLGLKEFEYKGNNILYRGTNISDYEITNLLQFYSQKKFVIYGEFQPLYLIYSRTYLSFSKNKNVSLGFIRNINGTKKVLFQLKNNLGSKIISNAHLYNISAIPNEDEILFFPFSAFLIENIIKQNDIYYINLLYMGIYENKIRTRITEMRDNNINDLLIKLNSSFTQDIFKSKIIPKKINNKNISYIEQNIINKIIEYNNSNDNNEPLAYLNNNVIISQKELTVIFTRLENKRSEDYEVKCKEYEKISVIIERFKKLRGDDNYPNLQFIYNSKPLNYNLTVGEVGLQDGSIITVVKKYNERPLAQLCGDDDLDVMLRSLSLFE